MTRKLPPLRALRAFEAAARQLSFVRAAEELHVTPAAVSQQIKLLEEQMGQALFQRSPTLSLTPPGQAALPLIRDAFDLMERAARQMRAAPENPPLIVSVPPSFAARWLIPRLERFQAAHPEIELRLLASVRAVDFEIEDVDAVVRYGGGNYPGLYAERLKDETIVVVAHPRLAAGLKRAEDLLGVTLLHNSAMGWDPTFPDWPSWLRNAGVNIGTPRIREFGDVNLVIEAALAGLGAALVWRTLIRDELIDGRLIALFPDQPLANSYHFVCPPEHLELPRVAAFRQWLREEMAREAT
ncbi:MAG TPA: transcriptional regulator GcvA [Rhodocyclaceae bacterium]